jgi:hypothetical protein
LIEINKPWVFAQMLDQEQADTALTALTGVVFSIAFVPVQLTRAKLRAPRVAAVAGIRSGFSW